MIKYLLLITVLYLIYIMDFNKNKKRENFLVGKSILNLKQAINNITFNTGVRNINSTKEIIYKYGTLDSNTLIYIRNLLKPLISKLKELTTENLKLHDIEYVKVNLDSVGIKKYYVEFFIHNFTNFIENKLAVELIVYKNNSIHYNFVKIYNNSNMFNPVDRNISNHYEMDNIVSKSKKIYSIIKGEYNSSLGQSIYQQSGKADEFRRGDLEFNEAKELKKQGYNSFPCRKIYNIWDKKGIQLVERCRKNCSGINSSTNNRNIIAKFYPSFNGNKYSNNKNTIHDMFDLSKGIPSNRQNIKIN